MKLTQLGIMDLATEPRDALGDSVPSFFYRYVTLFSISDALGGRAQDALFGAGAKIGEQLMLRMPFKGAPDMIEFYLKNGLGILSTERGQDGQIVLRLQECATCHGLPSVGKTLCHFDSGMLTAIVRVLLKGTADTLVVAEERQCVGLGDTECTFHMTLSSDGVRKLFPLNLTAR